MKPTTSLVFFMPVVLMFLACSRNAKQTNRRVHRQLSSTSEDSARSVSRSALSPLPASKLLPGTLFFPRVFRFTRTFRLILLISLILSTRRTSHVTTHATVRNMLTLSIACRLLFEYAGALEGGFLAHVPAAVSALLPAVTFRFNEEVS